MGVWHVLGGSGHTPLLFLPTCAISPGCASYLPMSGACIHYGVLGIYPTFGCWVRCHRPLTGTHVVSKSVTSNTYNISMKRKK